MALARREARRFDALLRHLSRPPLNHSHLGRCGAEGGDQLARVLRRVLSVAVKRGDDFHPRRADAAADCPKGRGWGRTRSHGQPAQRRSRTRAVSFARAVFDDDHLARLRPDERAKTARQRRQVLDLVMGGDDDGKLRLRHALSSLAEVAMVAVGFCAVRRAPAARPACLRAIGRESTPAACPRRRRARACARARRRGTRGATRRAEIVENAAYSGGAVSPGVKPEGQDFGG